MYAKSLNNKINTLMAYTELEPKYSHNSQVLLTTLATIAPRRNSLH